MLIKNATIINEGKLFEGSVLVEGERISAIFRNDASLPETTDVVDAKGMFLLPGVIDDHVHMRDPGLTHKADMHSETLAAAAGGVTSVMDMPNVLPQTTTMKLWRERMDYAARHCHVNYAFYLGATLTNLEEIKQIDTKRVPALKLFMGSSTGGMLVDKEEVLRNIFRHCPTIIMTHCEDTDRINARMKKAQAQWGDDPDVTHHPWIRDDEACYRSTALAVRLAKETSTRLHVAHITTRKELSLLPSPRSSFSPENQQDSPTANITAEVCPQHLYYSDTDYARLGTLIKCNPAIKSADDRTALREALCDGRINIVGTDHAPHLLSEKDGGARQAVSGMPLIQFSLPLMLTLASDGLCPLERIVDVMCHNPSRLFHIRERGFIRPGYHADLVLVKPVEWIVTRKDVISKCGWSPLEGEKLKWRVERTLVNGQWVFTQEEGSDETIHGQALEFN